MKVWLENRSPVTRQPAFFLGAKSRHEASKVYKRNSAQAKLAYILFLCSARQKATGVHCLPEELIWKVMGLVYLNYAEKEQRYLNSDKWRSIEYKTVCLWEQDLKKIQIGQSRQNHVLVDVGLFVTGLAFIASGIVSTYQLVKSSYEDDISNFL